MFSKTTLRNIVFQKTWFEINSRFTSRNLQRLPGIKIILKRNVLIKNMSSSRAFSQNGPSHLFRPEGSTPLFKFGIITDVQYGDVDDRLNYEGSVMRYYRNSVNLLKKAIKTWKSSGPKFAPDFVLQLGDLIEGSRVAFEDREKNLKTVIDCCLELDCYFCHLWGNHEFYLFSREELSKSLLNSKVEIVNHDDKLLGTTNELGKELHQNGMVKESNYCINDVQHTFKADKSSGQKYYFTFSPHPKFKFIALDSYDISICGRQAGEPEWQKAWEILSKNNYHSDWNNPTDLKRRHFVKFNGGLSQEQLDWLDTELKMAEDNDQNVVMMSHVPIHPGCTSDLCLVWNYEDVLDIIQKHQCVKVCFYGHTHDAKSCIDEHGIHHITYPAVLECKKDKNAFVTAFVYENRIELMGHGVIESHVVEF